MTGEMYAAAGQLENVSRPTLHEDEGCTHLRGEAVEVTEEDREEMTERGTGWTDCGLCSGGVSAYDYR